MNILETQIMQIIESQPRKSGEVLALIVELQAHADMLYENEENNAYDRNMEEIADQTTPEVEYDNE